MNTKTPTLFNTEIKALAEKHRKRVVGDDDQGIYGFR